MIDFIDAFFIGEGEDGIVDILRILMKGKRDSSGREKILSDLSALEGVFVPSLDYENNLSGATRKIRKRVYRGQPVVPLKPIVPNIRIAHERVVIEVTRGCGNLCKFCHAGYFTLPYRSYDPDHFKEKVLTLLRNTGYDEISLASLSLSDYRYLVPLLNALLNVACRADLVTIHSSAGGAAGTGVSCGTTVVADGTPAGALRVERTLSAETSLGILRYADAGYGAARDNVRTLGIRGLSPETDEKGGAAGPQ